MVSILAGLFFICSCLNNQALASLITCPTTAMTTTSIPYKMTLSSSATGSYPGDLLLSADGNFNFHIAVPDSGSPQSTIQGGWSSSDGTNTLTIIARTFQYFDLPKFSVNNLTCVYTCGTDNNALRACTLTYTLKSLQTIGTYSLALDLSIPE